MSTPYEVLEATQKVYDDTLERLVKAASSRPKFEFAASELYVLKQAYLGLKQARLDYYRNEIAQTS